MRFSELLCLVCTACARGEYSFPVLHTAEEYDPAARQFEHLRSVLKDIRPDATSAGEDPQNISERLTMPDGVTLSTTIVNPYPYDKKKPTIICRSPYGPYTSSIARLFLQYNGFVALMQETRGTFFSGGTFDMFRQAAMDGQATMKWAASQPWSNGEVYHVGISADGITEIESMLYPENYTKGMLWIWSASNGRDFIYPQGVYRKDTIETYLNFMALPTRLWTKLHTIPDIHKHEAWSDWWYNLTDCREQSGCHFDNLKWPLIVHAGWWDIFADVQINAYNKVVSQARADIAETSVLFIDPLGHCSLDRTSQAQVHLAGSDDALKSSIGLAVEYFGGSFNGPARSAMKKMNVFIMGDYADLSVGNYWTHFDKWPATKDMSLFLRAGHALGEAPDAAEASESFEADYANPAPITGGYNIPTVAGTKGCGTSDNSAREARDDVVVFDGEPLAEDTAILGHMNATLFVSSDAVDTDFVVTVSDLSANKSMLVKFGAMRMRWRGNDTTYADHMQKGVIYEVSVDLGHVGYIFPRGHRVRVTVSSAAAPFYKQNCNTGNFEETEWFPGCKKAQNAVHFSSKHPSRVILPIVDMNDIPKAAPATTTKPLAEYV